MTLGTWDWVGVAFWFTGALGACTTTTPVAGPDGTEHNLIRCLDTADCYDQAAELCNGPYTLVDSGNRSAGSVGQVSNGTWSATNISWHEMLVKCGAEKQSGAATASTSEAAPSASKELSEADAPKDAAGFSFGETVDAAKAVCEGAELTWAPDGISYRCSGTPVETGLGAHARLRFCKESLCRIEVVIPPPANGSATTADRIAKIVSTLTAKYGSPLEHDVIYRTDCSGDALHDCLQHGTAHFWYEWKWSGRAKLLLSLGQREQPAGQDEASDAKLIEPAKAWTIRIRYEDGRPLDAPGKNKTAETHDGPVNGL